MTVRPCPFCGFTGITYELSKDGSWGAAACQGCGAIGPEVLVKHNGGEHAKWHEEALREWNNRVSE